ncbi:MAG: GDP-L-fucose synthase family protein [Bacteroidia bacterium]
MRIYVAGHRGLVGSHLVHKLHQKGYANLLTPARAELDLRNQHATQTFFLENRPEWVFLAAAKVGGILANSTYKAEFLYDNLAIAVNVIDSAYRSGVQKLLNLGSSCIYPKFAPQPMKEEYLLTGSLEPTNEPYAIAKITAIKLCRYYNEQYGTRFFSVMPTNLYGPRDNFNLETSHVLPALIRKFHLAKLLQKNAWEALLRDLRTYPLGFGLDKQINYESPESIRKALEKVGITPARVTLWGTGQPYREFLYIEDLAEACLFLMENVDPDQLKAYCPDYFVNVGTGEDIRIRDLAQKVAAVVGYDGEIYFDSSRPDGTPRKLLDVSKIKALGWEPRVSLEEGLQKTYFYYTSQSPQI